MCRTRFPSTRTRAEQDFGVDRFLVATLSQRLTKRNHMRALLRIFSGIAASLLAVSPAAADDTWETNVWKYGTEVEYQCAIAQVTFLTWGVDFTLEDSVNGSTFSDATKRACKQCVLRECNLRIGWANYRAILNQLQQLADLRSTGAAVDERVVSSLQQELAREHARIQTGLEMCQTIGNTSCHEPLDARYSLVLPRGD